MIFFFHLKKKMFFKFYWFNVLLREWYEHTYTHDSVNQINKGQLCFGPCWAQKLNFGPYKFTI